MNVDGDTTAIDEHAVVLFHSDLDIIRSCRITARGTASADAAAAEAGQLLCCPASAVLSHRASACPSSPEIGRGRWPAEGPSMLILVDHMRFLLPRMECAGWSGGIYSGQEHDTSYPRHGWLRCCLEGTMGIPSAVPTFRCSSGMVAGGTYGGAVGVLDGLLMPKLPRSLRWLYQST